MFWKNLDRLIDLIASVCLILTASTTALQVFYRYVLNRPLLWPLEVSLFLFVYLVWFGGVAGIRDRREIRIELAEKFLPESIQRFLLPILTLISLCVTILVVFYGIKVTSFQSTAVYDALPFPRSVFFAVAPIAGGLMSLYLLKRLIGQLSRLFSSGGVQMKGD